MPEPLKLANTTEQSGEWLIFDETYRRLFLVVNVISGIPVPRWTVERLKDDGEYLCVMMTTDFGKATKRYSAIEEIIILSEPVLTDEEYNSIS